MRSQLGLACVCLSIVAGCTVVTDDVAPLPPDDREVADQGALDGVPVSSQLLLVMDAMGGCDAEPCPAYAVISVSGEQFDARDVVFPGPTSEDMRAALAAGGLLVEGIVDRDGASAVIDVVGVVGPVSDYEVASSGLSCVTAPCPMWKATDEYGEQSKVASIDLSAMRLPAEDIDRLSAALARGRSVKGWLVPGPWGPGEPGDVLFVTRLVEY